MVSPNLPVVVADAARTENHDLVIVVFVGNASLLVWLFVHVVLMLSLGLSHVLVWNCVGGKGGGISSLELD